MYTLTLAIFGDAGDLVIPGWFMAIAGILIAWAVWATLQLFQNKSDIKVNAALDKQFRESIDGKFNKIESDISEVKDNVKEYGKDLKELSAQIMQYLIHEIKKR